MLTPFTKDEMLDEEGLRTNVDFLIDNGVHGLVPVATSGEYPHLSETEWKRTLDIVVDQVNGKVPVIAGTTAMTTINTIKRTKYAEDAGAHGAMVLASPYYLLTEEAAFQYFKTVAESVDFPIVLYGHPYRAKFDLSPEFVAKMVDDVSNIQYIKDSTSDIRRVHQYLRSTNGKITVFAGMEQIALSSFALGAKGWITATGNFLPRVMSQICELAIEKKDFENARELYFRILPLPAYIMSGGKWLALSKACMTMVGGVGGYPRRPLLPVTKVEKEKLRKILVDIGALQ